MTAAHQVPLGAGQQGPSFPSRRAGPASTSGRCGGCRAGGGPADSDLPTQGDAGDRPPLPRATRGGVAKQFPSLPAKLETLQQHNGSPGASRAHARGGQHWARSAFPNKPPDHSNAVARDPPAPQRAPHQKPFPVAPTRGGSHSSITGAQPGRRSITRIRPPSASTLRHRRADFRPTRNRRS